MHLPEVIIIMKRIIFLIIILLLLIILSTCPGYFNNNHTIENSSCNIPIIWKADIIRPFYFNMVSDNSGIYVYNYKENDFTTVRLNKIDPETGKTLWTTDYFEEVTLYQPIIIDNYIYATLDDDIILCFNKNTGEPLARVRIVNNNPNMWVTSDYFYYKNYFYFGYGDLTDDDYYLGRININAINKNIGMKEQLFEPELMGKSHYNTRIRSKPIVYHDIVYFNTIVLDLDIPVELIGINIINNKEMFYEKFGGDGYYNFDRGKEINSLYIINEKLYYISESIAAYNLKTNNKIYHIIFDINTQKNNDYGAGGFTVATYYNNMFYYTTTGSNYLGETGLKNIFCINANNGKLIWSDIPEKSESLGTNPIIYDNKVFIPHMNGIRVYNADSGRLIAIEKSIEGNANSYNQLLGSKMITVEDSDEYPDGQIIALDLSQITY